MPFTETPGPHIKSLLRLWASRHRRLGCRLLAVARPLFLKGPVC